MEPDRFLSFVTTDSDRLATDRLSIEWARPKRNRRKTVISAVRGDFLYHSQLRSAKGLITTGRKLRQLCIFILFRRISVRIFQSVKKFIHYA